MASWERWGWGVVRRWKGGKRCEGSEVARWENGEVARWEVPGFIQEWGTRGET